MVSDKKILCKACDPRGGAILALGAKFGRGPQSDATYQISRL